MWRVSSGIAIVLNWLKQAIDKGKDIQSREARGGCEAWCLAEARYRGRGQSASLRLLSWGLIQSSGFRQTSGLGVAAAAGGAWI